MTDKQPDEALEKLNQGIQESRQAMQRQTMELAQEYFGDSVEGLKRQIKESRSTVERLPEQLPGGQEESFQMLFQELMNSYSKIENCLQEAEGEVASLDTESLRRQGEVEASEAALREAREHGVDLTQVEGSGE
jgi:pyruvate/2-oxoglutarate dehydrogenase complex dihydrolipoamide acyltransferase (E2) component